MKSLNKLIFNTLVILILTGVQSVTAQFGPPAGPFADFVEITGTAEVGEILTGSYEYNDPDGLPEDGTTYQWYRLDSQFDPPVPIDGATALTYTLTAEDDGKVIVFEVTPSNGTDTGMPTPSDPFGPIVSGSGGGNNPPTVSNVSFSGTLEVGSTLTGSYDYDDADGDAESGSVYTWFRSDDNSGTNKTEISGADQNTYELVNADEGKYISFSITPNDGTDAGNPGESSLQGPVQAESAGVSFAGGNGSEGDPFQITTAEQLQEINNNLTDYFIITQDIDASGTSGWNSGAGFAPIGSGAPFTGNLDGQGYKITSLFINRPTTDNVALFATIGNGGVVDSLGIDQGDVTGAQNSAGLAGENYGTITNSYYNGTVSGTSQVGGLVGQNGSNITTSYSTGSVTATGSDVGGLVGNHNLGTISTSYSTSTVSGGNNAGGFAGFINDNIDNSFATGDVTGTDKVGGFIGNFDSGVISNSFSTGEITGSTNIGGFAGFKGGFGSAQNSFWDTDSSGTASAVGAGSTTGITGKTSSEMKMESTYTDAGWDFTDVWEIIAGVNNGYPIQQDLNQEGSSENTAPTVSNLVINNRTNSGNSPAEGDQLAVTYDYSDADSDPESGTTFQWYRADDNSGTNAAQISGATDSTYSVVSGDVGKFLRVDVTPNDGTDAGTLVSSSYTEVPVSNQPPSAGIVSITGTPGVGETLTADYSYSDPDSDPEGSTTFQWYVAADDAGTGLTPIPDATSQTYVVTPADEGVFVSVEVTPNDGNQNGSVSTSDFVQINIRPFLNPDSTRITGTPEVGSSIFAVYEYNDFDGDPNAGAQFEWLVSDDASGTNEAVISGATDSSYVVQLGDAGKFIRVEVTPFDGTSFGIADTSAFVEILVPNTNPVVTNPIADYSVDEDAADSVFNLVDIFSDTEDNDADLSYSIVSNSNTNLISAAVNNTTDELTLSLTADSSGTANITIRATDSGGLTADTSFTVTVNPVNDVPVFTKGADQVLDENSGVQTINGWATGISAGAGDETGQALNFNISTDNDDLFSVLPTVDPSTGNLTFTPAADSFGVATVTISLSDNGGTANGGSDTSADQTFTITVEEVITVDPLTGFISTWRTTSPNESITLFTTGGADISDYDAYIDWGDGTDLEQITGDDPDPSHEYATAGDYEVRVYNTFPRLDMTDGADLVTYGNTPALPANSAKLIAINQWGDIAWESVKNMFYQTPNLVTYTATDTPDLSMASSAEGMFAFTGLTTADLSDWDVSTITDFSSMFSNALSFNGDLSDWVFSSAPFSEATALNFTGMFNLASSFTGTGLANWDVSNAQTMTVMFSDAAAFNQDLSSWDISNVTDMFFFAKGTALSTTNYTNMLAAWGTLSLQSGVDFSVGTTTYSIAGLAGRDELTDTFSWSVTDGGLTAGSLSLTTTESSPIDTSVTDTLWMDLTMDGVTIRDQVTPNWTLSPESGLTAPGTPVYSATLGQWGYDLSGIEVNALDQEYSLNISASVALENGISSVEDDFSINITVPNTAPIILSAIADFAVDEDAANTVIDLTSVFSDAEQAVGDLIFSIESNLNTNLVNAAVDNTSDELTLALVADSSGSANITIRATDSGGLDVDNSFVLTVNPVNDEPTVISPIAAVTVDENAASTVIDLSTNFSDVETASGSLTYTVESNDNPILVTATINDSALTLDYQVNQFGTANITVRASDGELSVDDTFMVTVNEVNDPPVFPGRYDISTAVLSSSEDSYLGGTRIIFNGDGTKVYAFNNVTEEVTEFTLNPAFDLPTASNEQMVFTFGDEVTSIRDVKFNGTGTKMFVFDGTNRNILEYSLDIPYDVSTAMYSGEGEKLDVSSDVSYAASFSFNMDGTKMFVLDGDFNNVLVEYNLSTAYDVSIAVFAGEDEKLNVPDNVISASDFAFNGDGTKLFILDGIEHTVVEYNLNTNYDISEAVYAGVEEEFDHGNVIGSGRTIQTTEFLFDGDGTKMYIYTDIGGSYFKYLLDNPTSASFAENGSGTVIDINANDGNGGAADVGLTYSIIGGADAGTFNIDGATGVITFKNVPDFEAPSDADNNNEYEITVEANDGEAEFNTSSITLTIAVYNVNEIPVASDVMIAGTPKVGEVLAATYAYSDIEGDANAGANFQWYVSADTLTVSTEISGATDSTFTPTSAQAAKFVKVEVTPNDGFDLGAVVSSPWVEVPSLFFLAENGVTITCKDTSPGDTGVVGGVTYTAVDETTLRSMVSNGDDVTVACTSLVTDMNQLFESLSFNQDISTWDVSAVVNMSEMFFAAYLFDQDISNWDVSSVTDMSYMFIYASAFNQDLSSWNVGAVTNMKNMFQQASAFNQPIGVWNVSSVTDMSDMFRNASAFNQPIGSWNVTSVEDMNEMFDGATSFNQDLSNWGEKTSKVTNMSSMFGNASSFNQDVSSWDISSVTTMNNMFAFATSFSTANYDALLNGWSVLPSLQSNVDLGVSTKYSPAASTARAKLENDYGWVITDAGRTNVAPVASEVLIAGTPKVGEVLTTTYIFSDADGDANAGANFQWYVSADTLTESTEIPGATDSTFTPTSAQAEKFVKVEVTPNDGFDLGTAVSSAWVEVPSLFFLAENGVTITCKDTSPGDTGVVGGVTYTAVDEATLRGIANDATRWDELQSVCTSGITNMKEMFYDPNFEIDFSGFNTDISHWDMSEVTDFSNFLDYTSFSQSNYSALIEALSTQTLQSGTVENPIKFGVYGLTYAGADLDKKINIIDMYNWDFEGDAINAENIVWTPVQTNPTLKGTDYFQFKLTIDGLQITDAHKSELLLNWGSTIYSDYQTPDVLYQGEGVWGALVSDFVDVNDFPAEKVFTISTVIPNAFGGTTNHTSSDFNLTLEIQYSDKFSVLENGVTVVCADAAVDEKGFISYKGEDRVFTKRSKDQITTDNAASTCTSGIMDMSYLFDGKTDFNQDISSWDVSQVVNMEKMFNNANSFNQDISKWDVSSVTNMYSMFFNAQVFNHDVSDWQVGAVTNMGAMFNSATEFNQDLSNWNFSSVTGTNNMLDDSGIDIMNYSALLETLGSEDKGLNAIENETGEFGANGLNYLYSTIPSRVNLYNLPYNIVGDKLELGEGGSFDLAAVSEGSVKDVFNFTASVVDKASSEGMVNHSVTDNLFITFNEEDNPGLSIEELDYLSGLSATYAETEEVWKLDVSDLLQNIPAGGTFTFTASLATVADLSVELPTLSFNILPTFKLAENGVTVTCTEAEVGNTGIVNGITFTKRTKDQITTSNATTTCTSGITDMSSLFDGETDFNQDISSWDVSSVTTMSLMFYQASAFNQDLSNWDVSSVTDMGNMFETATAFNQDISGWDVSSVTNMMHMFNFATSFNQDISGWNVSSVNNMPGMFYGAKAFNQDISSWDVSSVTDMRGMFSTAHSFNQYIGDWDVSNVTDMAQMFNHAFSFNQDIGNWDVSNVTDMSAMFYFASAFNQNLGNWDVSRVTSFNSEEINFLVSTALSTNNYDSLLIGWSKLENLQPNLSIGFIGVKYSSAASVARAKLTNEYGWVITDAGRTNVAPVASDVLIVGNPKVGDQLIVSYTFTDTDGDNESGSSFQWYVADDASGTNAATITDSTANTFTPTSAEAGKFIKVEVIPNDGFELGTAVSSFWVEVPNLFFLAENGVTITCKDASPGDTGVVGGVTYTAVDETTLGMMVSNDEDVTSVCTSLITDMTGLFLSQPTFNQDISSWDVSSVTSMLAMFSEATSFNQPIDSWDVSSVELMVSMFSEATSFNQPIDNWDVSSVTDMKEMFLEASSFNQPLGSWDVSSVTDMSFMFLRAMSFDQNLGGWDISKVTSFETYPFGFMEGSGLTTVNYDSLLIGWATLPSVQPNLEFGVGDVQYSPAASAARAKLTGAPNNWTITDGGQINNPPVFAEASDVSGAEYAGAGEEFSVAARGLFPLDLTFSADGTKLFVIEFSGNAVVEYTLMTAWDVSTAVYGGAEEDLSVLEPVSLAFNRDGTKLFVISIEDDAIVEYSLDTAWDVSTAKHAGEAEEFSVAAQESSPTGLAFNGDGTKMFVIGDADGRIVEYSLGTAWDVSTAIYEGAEEEFRVADQESSPTGLAFNRNGTKLFVIGESDDAIGEYSLMTAWDVSTAVYGGAEEEFSVAAQEGAPTGMAFNGDETKLFVIGYADQSIVEYNLAPGTLTSTTFAENGTGTVIDANAINGDGGGADEGLTYLITGGDDANAFQIDASTGILTFKDTPDFEQPADADADNVYEVTIQADDGQAENNTASIELTITVTDVEETTGPTAVVSPKSDTTGVAVDALITATFSEAVSVLNLDNITIADKDEVNVTGVSGSLTDSTLTISHDRFKPFTKYTVTIPAATIQNAEEVPNSTLSWSFTTGLDLKIATTLISPADEATDVALKPTFTWNSLQGISEYELMGSLSENFSDPTIIKGISDTTYTLSTELNIGVTFHWRVRGTTGSDTTAWSDPFSFTTTQPHELFTSVNKVTWDDNGTETNVCPAGVDVGQIITVWITITDDNGKVYTDSDSEILEAYIPGANIGAGSDVSFVYDNESELWKAKFELTVLGSINYVIDIPSITSLTKPDASFEACLSTFVVGGTTNFNWGGSVSFFKTSAADTTKSKQNTAPFILGLQRLVDDGTGRQVRDTLKVVIDWGDEAIEYYQGVGYPSHTYAEAKDYNIRVAGNHNSFKASAAKNQITGLKSVSNWGEAKWKDLSNAFEGAVNLNITAEDNPDLTDVKSLKQMFKGARSFNAPVNNWDVSNITNMASMFQGARSFNQDISSWDISNVKYFDVVTDDTETAAKANTNAQKLDVKDIPELSGPKSTIRLADITGRDYSPEKQKAMTDAKPDSITGFLVGSGMSSDNVSKMFVGWKDNINTTVESINIGSIELNSEGAAALKALREASNIVVSWGGEEGVDDEPVFSALPNPFNIKTEETRILNLWDYVSDEATPDNELDFKFGIVSDSAETIGFDNSNGDLSITARADADTFLVAIQVTNNDNIVSLDTLEVQTSPLFTSIKDMIAEVPFEADLKQNYPNPFNPSTVIRYGVPKAGEVRLEVYDLIGRKVATLIDNERKTAGWHQVTFDASNLASGIYFYRIVAGKYVEARRMTLIK